jgi:molybdate transport repressor ModE-like protein
MPAKGWPGPRKKGPGTSIAGILKKYYLCSMLEDNRVKVFLTVLECGNFTAAAYKLGISQPAVSQNIAELERLLGVQLIERTRGEISLTDDGRLFEGYARQIAHWYAVADRAFHPDPLALHPQPEKPAVLRLDDGRTAEVWVSGSDIHIELK